MDGSYYDEGARLPIDPFNPCHACYCIRNVSVCTKETCELNIPGCYPRYKIGSCCPERYTCSMFHSFFIFLLISLVMFFLNSFIYIDLCYSIFIRQNFYSALFYCYRRIFSKTFNQNIFRNIPKNIYLVYLY